MFTKDSVHEFTARVSTMNESEINELDAELLISVPETIESGSVDEFIYGCLSEQSGSFSLCVPSCVNGYKPSNMTSCDMAVFQKSDNKIKKINKVKSKKAYIYLDQDETLEMSPDDIKQFTVHDKVKELYVYKTRDNGLYEHIDTIQFHKQIPRIKTPVSSTGIVAFLIILFILILIIIYFYHIWINKSAKFPNFVV